MGGQRKTVHVIATLAVATIVAATLVLARQPWAGGSEEALARGGPIAPATPSPGGPSDKPASPPGGALDAAVVDHPWQAGVVLHWTLASYDFATESLDPNNGLALAGEVWTRIGDDGTPVEFIGRYATADGKVVQAIHQTVDSQTVALAEPVPSGHPDGGSQCVLEMPASPDELAGVLPVFVSAGALRASAFRESTADAPVPIANLVPRDEGPALAFSRLLKGTTANLEQTVRINAAEGHVTTWHSVQRSGGVLTAEHIESQGPVSVLSLARMPNADQVLEEVDCGA